MSKFNAGFKTLLLQGLSEPGFYGDLMYKFRKVVSGDGFLIISGGWLFVVAGLVLAWVFCGGRHAWLLVRSGGLFGCTAVGRASDWVAVHLGPYLRVTLAVDSWRPFRVVLGRACRGLADGFLMLWSFGVAVPVGPHVCFILVFRVGVFRANRATKCLRNQDRAGGEG